MNAQNTAQQSWEVAYNQLELQFDRATFDTWLRGAAFIDVEDGVFVIGVRNGYVRDMLQHRLYRNVRRVLSDACGEQVELRFVIKKAESVAKDADSEMPLFRLLAQQTDDTPTEPLHERVARPQRSPLPESTLNPRFTFERFIVHGSNRITYQAARSVAENPARSYNPLVVYGGVGLGKTHLLQAIAHEFIKKGLNAIYIPSEVFTNDLVAAIRSKNTAMFRDKYRSVDALLVDDVQFIAGKESTQEEFFHTFNALNTFNKQIVLASDRHPRELTTLEDRLRSRFAGGLVTDVQPLEFESRTALLEMWAQEQQVILPPSVLSMVAERGSSNVRELEGVFNQVVAQARLSPDAITISGAEQTLHRFNQPRQHGRRIRITLDQVIEATSEHFNIPLKDIIGKRRTVRINRVRQIAMYLTRELTNASLPQIGEVFGGRSHSTILHGCNKIAEEMTIDDGLCHHIVKIRAILTSVK